jgi:L-alanine-DL-glutamate epimerase-like enolase superfamily enzyme
MSENRANDAMERVERAANTASRPSDLKITDLRVTRIKASYDYILVRIDTNQGVYGIGESHESSHIENVLQYKSFLLGQNPCNVDMLFNAIKPFGNWGTEGGGVSGIEIALWDLVGRVYGVPCYQFLGGKYRDTVRLYADTPSPDEPTPEGYARRVVERKDQGITIIKFDVGIQVMKGYVPDGLLAEPALTDYPLSKRFAARGLPGSQLTDKGVERYVEIVSEVRSAVGPTIPLAIDHFGPISVKDAIKIGNALDGYGMAWLEDMLPVYDWRGNREVTRNIPVPTLNGEQGYLLAGLKKLIKKGGVDILQPDLVTVGGMAELKRVADYAEERGIPTVLHCAGSPVMFMANIHCAAAIHSLVAQEIHSLDIPFWRDLVTGLPEPFIEDGYVRIPDKPGLGIELNEEVIKEHLRFGGYFDPTEEWNQPKLGWWIPRD